MNVDDETQLPAGSDNPFPGTAVASIFDVDIDVPTIETPAIRDAAERLDAYLRRPAATGEHPPGPEGSVIAIVGDYGTGKTHLAAHLLRQVERSAEANVRHMYIDAQAGSFSALYHRNFIGRLKPAEVRQRVREYYADIVADSLRSDAFPTEVTERLRDGKIDPQKFVQQFGLMDSVFLQELRDRLHRVTRNDAFSTALVLLLRGGFDREVWEWFRGADPDPLLAERGITTTLDDDTSALEAIGVFAILYGGRHHRFVLVIDELERVLSSSSRPPEASIDAFKTLLTVAGNAGIFLVLCGLPDFLGVLGGNVRDRIGHVVRASALEPDDVCEYIADSVERVRHRRELTPFSPEVVGYLTWLADGNARRVIQLCHSCYHLSGGTEPVREATVRDAAREHFEFTSLKDVHAQVRQVLDSGARRYRADHAIDGPGEPRVDFWIPMGHDGRGCAVLLTDSVLKPADLDTLARRAEAVHAAVAETSTLLIVNGYLTPEFVPGLRTAFSEEPLVYSARRFADDLEAALHGITRRLQATIGDDMQVIREHVERMTQMQTSTQRFVEELAVQVQTMRSVSDQQLARIERDLDSLAGAGPATGSATAARPVRGRMPARVEKLFAEALGGLDGLNNLDSLLKDAFTTRHTKTPNASVGRALLRGLSDQGAFDAVGVASLAQTTVAAFRDAVRDWFAQLEPGSAVDPLSDDRRSTLASICRAYDSVFEYLPLFKLDELSGTATRLGAHDSVIDQATRPLRQADVRATLDRLGGRVQSAVLGELRTPDMT